MFVWWSLDAIAQDHEHHHPEPAPTEQPAAKEQPALLAEQVRLNASGTAWQPPTTPMFMFAHATPGKWMLMFHGQAFVGVDATSSDRGNTSFEAIHSVMGMASRPIGRIGWIGGRVMLTAEPATIGKEGYPHLLQSGETLNGEPLHDAQHAHDLFMEIAATGRLALGKSAGLELYLAPSGEPALGPPAFMHRASGMSDPLAPLGHHWMDSTHITFGVATLGVFTKFVKLEGSWFNGREPDEERWDFDFDTFDSASGRLSVVIGEEWAFQASYGYLGNPEALHPGAVHRFTASGSWHTTWADGRAYAATMAAWGRNAGEKETNLSDPPQTHGHAVPTDSVLLESTVDPLGPLLTYLRLSREVKTAQDLVVDGFDEEDTFDLYTAALGGAVLLPIGDTVETGVGVRGTLSLIPNDLEPTYGTRTPAGVFVYAQIRPAPTSSSMSHHHH